MLRLCIAIASLVAAFAMAAGLAVAAYFSAPLVEDSEFTEPRGTEEDCTR